MKGGVEWIVDATGCDPARISHDEGLRVLQRLFEEIVRVLELHPLGSGSWHRFPGAGGITGIVALSESHLACHSYPESGYLSLNLYTCRRRMEPNRACVIGT